MSIYLIHSPRNQADPELVARMERLGAAVADFFDRASGGRMKILPTRP